MIRNEKCEVLDKQNSEPKYRRVYDIWWCLEYYSKIDDSIAIVQIMQFEQNYCN
jgi:hypothetical protein